LDSGFSIAKAHGWGDHPASQNRLFVPAVLIRILDLHGNSYFRADNLIDRANHLIMDDHDLRHDYLEIRSALQNILGLHAGDSLGNLCEVRFKILAKYLPQAFQKKGWLWI